MSEPKDKATAAPSPIDALAHLLANPQVAIEQRESKEPPRLRVFAG